jgi:GT2 family glycosyltransferase
MHASVIVPAYNAAATLGACLAALDAQTLAREQFEVIVVDDGSTDATAQIALDHGARLVRQPNQGQAAARNHGVAEAQGEIVAFTDADCAPAPEWLAELVSAFADPSIVGSKGVYRTRQRSLAARFAQIEYEERYEGMARARFIDFVDTYSAAYRRSVFVENGGFDTSFPGDSSGEDQEFSFRLSERGYTMLFVAGAAVYHRHPPTVAAYYRRKYKTGYWKALVLRLHPQKAVHDTHTPALLKVQMGLLAISLPVICVGALSGMGAWALPLMAAVLGLSYAPFTGKAWRKDKAIAAVAPLMLTVRAVALGTGLLRGLWDSWRKSGALGERLPGRTQERSRE